MSTFVFFHVGNDPGYLKMVGKFVASVHETNPNAEVVMISDEKTPEVAGVTRRINVAANRKELMVSRLKAYAEAKIHIPAVYTDTDMIVCSRIDPEKILGNHRVVFCERSFDRALFFNYQLNGMNMSEHKGKRMYEVYPYLGCVTVTADPGVWAELAALSENMPEQYRKWYGDQEAIREWAAVNPHGKLSESEYACLPERASGFKPKILHYKGNRKSSLYE